MRHQLQILLPSPSWLFAVLFCGLGLIGLQAEVVKPEWALSPLYGEGSPNYITVGAGWALVDGDDGAFRRRADLRDFSAGIDELYYYREFDASQLVLLFDGHVDSYDARLKVEYDKWDAWYLHGGFKQYRSYDDASAGYAPASGIWVDPSKDYLELDRGELWLEWGTLDASKPIWKLRYSLNYRSGEKSSTSWGNTAGLPLVAPAWRDINEVRHRLEADVKKRGDDVTWGSGVHVEHATTENTFNAVTQAPGTQIKQREKTESNSGGGYAYVSKVLSERANLSVGSNVLFLDANIDNGERINVGYNIPYMGLSGDADMTRYGLDAALNYRWIDKLVSTLRFGAVKEEADGSANSNLGINASESEDTRYDAVLETRYSGLKKIVLYASAEGSIADGKQEEDSLKFNRMTDSEQNIWELAAGIRWYPLSNLNARLQYSHREQTDDYEHIRLDNFPPVTAYPGYITNLERVTDKVGGRLSWRPANNWLLITNGGYSQSTTESDYTSGLGTGEAEMENISISQTASWTPKPGLFLQGSVGYTVNTLGTPANDLGGALANLVPESANDYWVLNLNAYAVIDEKTDLQAGYDFYLSDNYTDTSSTSVPYDASQTEHRFNIVLSRQLEQQTRLQLRYAYYFGEDDTSGGFNDYEAHLIYLSLRHSF